MALLALTLCTALFLGVHLIPMNPLWRAPLVERLGENGYKAAFSVVALVGLIGAVVAYRSAPHIQLWSSPPPIRGLTAILMLAAVLCFACAKGVPWFKRVVRHPMLWGMGLLGVAHLLSNGEVPGLILFGGLAVFGFGWQRLTDRRDALVDPDGWAETERTTSFWPFAKWHVAGGEAAKVTVRPLLIGAAVYVVLILVHPWLFGVPVIPS